MCGEEEKKEEFWRPLMNRQRREAVTAALEAEDAAAGLKRRENRA
jgi:hypothetical protein